MLINRVNQAQIARVSGLSRQTVSFALNDRLRSRLNLETCRHILDTAKRLGYVPNLSARRLIRSRFARRDTSFDQVGLIYLSNPDNSSGYVDPVCLAMMQGAEHELSKLHASLTFVRVTEPGDWEKVERLVRAGCLDGWLLYGPVNDEVANRLNTAPLSGVPYVILGDHQCTRSVHSVNVDHAAVGRLAVQHLASLGHRRIAFLGSHMRYVYERETLAGFRAAVKELRLDEDDRLIGNFSSWTDGPEARLVEWLRNADPMPSAVFASEFDLSPWVRHALREAQIEVPKQISVLACESASPATQRENFTRIELPMIEVGRLGAVLLHQIASKPGVKTSEVRIAPSLIEGWSTQPRQKDE